MTEEKEGTTFDIQDSIFCGSLFTLNTKPRIQTHIELSTPKGPNYRQ
jgi:hypothetical protein